MSANRACIVSLFGSTGSGKSTFVRRVIERKKVTRSIIWNPMQAKTPYAGDVVTKLADLLTATRQKKFRVVFVPIWDFDVMKEQFDAVCEIALDRENLTFVAEELKHVTRPQWAPPNWRRATGDGRQYGLSIFGTSQRPAQVDGDFFGNCTVIRTGRLTKADDRKKVAENMMIPLADVEALQPLDWIEKDMETGNVASGRLTF